MNEAMSIGRLGLETPVRVRQEAGERASGSVPRVGVTRVLLIGTASAVRAWCGAASAMAAPVEGDGIGDAVRVAGALLVGPLGGRCSADSAEAQLPEGACASWGGVDDLDRVLRERVADFDRVLLCVPSALRGLVGTVGRRLDAAGVAWSEAPVLSDVLLGRAGSGFGAAHGRGPAELDLSALIDRTPRALDEAALSALVGGRTVMITGAGGSIGSELARIVSRFGPGKLVLVERSENALFEVQRELRPAVGDRLDAVMHDVTQRERTADLLARLRPDVVLHAAAHKHVPMMENHPAEAVENNLYGTRSIADAADAAGVERFVMISTDKAVNPSSVMGATKRLAEMYIRDLNRRSGTRFGMVRFGNVLGSACSVLPIWSDQLRKGGPITVTHEAMTRYFMTIPEAAGLVLEAACLAGSSGGGEVLLLDMGEPVRVLDMAERFLRLQGLEPGRDVAIEITGPRPGEKLFEELAYDGEDMLPTPHPSIRIWRTGVPDGSHLRRVLETFDGLRNGTGGGASGQPWRNVEPAVVVAALRALLPEMVLAAA